MELREKLKYGDVRQIAELSGMGYEMTRSVIMGRRRNKRINAIAAELIESREKIAAKNRKV